MFWFSAYNLLVTLVIASQYYRRVGMGPGDAAMVLVANLSHFGIHWVGLGTAFFLVSLAFRRRPGPFHFLLAILVTAGYAALVTDVRIFQLYRYHANAIVLQIVFGGALGESVRLGFATVLAGLAIIASLACSQALYFLLLEPRLSRLSRLNTLGFKTRAIAALLAIIAADKLFYGFDKLYNNTGYLRFTKEIPGYHPFVMKKFGEKWLGYRVEAEDTYQAPSSGTLLQYPPLGSLPRKPASPLPNILVMVPDGMRWDMATSDIMPKTARFARDSWRYRNHFSGGNTTEHGFFSMLYGIPATYWSSFLAERRGPALVDLMKKLGYEFRIISSTRLTFPELDRTCFMEVPGAIADQLGGSRPAERDGRQTAELFRFLDRGRDKGKPFFALLYFDASHGPYDSPEGYSKFQPTGGQVNFLSLDESKAVTVRNKYKNALNFLDSVMGRAIDGLGERGLLERTAVIITGDHGEEFWESGYYGHTDAFSVQQCRTCLIARWPGRGSRVVDKVTTHCDVAFTLFELLGYPDLGRRYTLGSSMLSPRPLERWNITGYHSGAIYTKDRIITFTLDSKKRMELEVRGWDYKPLPAEQQKTELRKYRPYLLETLDEQRRFYR